MVMDRHLVLRLRLIVSLLERRRMGHVPAELLAQGLRIVGVHLHIKLRPRDGYIGNTVVQ
jgi:hypothetical protein